MIHQILKSKLFWIVVGLAIMIFVLVQLGAVGAGTSYIRQVLIGQERQLIEDLKSKLKEVESKAKQLELSSNNLQRRIVEKDNELKKVQDELKTVKRRLSDAETKLSNISVPDSVGDRIKQFHDLGLKSATPVRPPK